MTKRRWLEQHKQLSKNAAQTAGALLFQAGSHAQSLAWIAAFSAPIQKFLDLNSCKSTTKPDG
jgi:hypothetical protein